MYNQQNGAQPDCANRQQPVFVALVCAIQRGERKRIVKHQRGGLETYAVLGPVAPVLVFVPLKAHRAPVLNSVL